MNRTVLQIPVSKALRTQAENAAYDFGFSSLQEVIRVFMTKLAKKSLVISFQEVRELSSKAKLRYEKMDQDFAAGKNIFFAQTVDELEKQLAK